MSYTSERPLYFHSPVIYDNKREFVMDRQKDVLCQTLGMTKTNVSAARGSGGTVVTQV